MRTTCEAFKQYDAALKNLRQDFKAAQRFTAFEAEEIERLVKAGCPRMDAKELALIAA